jgi:D-threo-aldose 1-dehydrogenase
MTLSIKKPLGKTGLLVPPIVFGTSYLGNLYQDLPFDGKLALAKGWFDATEKPVVIDTAGKYGAGLALENIGKLLTELNINPSEITISNKLGWYRVPLTKPEPTFEPGVWKNLEYDAIQKISYKGILECWEQGNTLLGGTYKAAVVSVHDPDEYLAAATNELDRTLRFNNVIDAYNALFELKSAGLVKAIGVGSKDWKIIRELYNIVPFDWVMIANSFTIMNHSQEFLQFLDKLHSNGVGVINSAVFQGGFLTGGDFFDYRLVDTLSSEGQYIYSWRNKFNQICDLHKVKPDVACIKFAMSHPAVAALALNTSKVSTMQANVQTMETIIPPVFWNDMKKAGLISVDYKYV